MLSKYVISSFILVTGYEWQSVYKLLVYGVRYWEGNKWLDKRDIKPQNGHSYKWR